MNLIEILEIFVGFLFFMRGYGECKIVLEFFVRSKGFVRIFKVLVEFVWIEMCLFWFVWWLDGCVFCFDWICLIFCEFFYILCNVFNNIVLYFYCLLFSIWVYFLRLCCRDLGVSEVYFGGKNWECKGKSLVDD